ncbi:MAG: CDP-diacylglycerol--glycerol-3-phosphate 3-phosphatidyltransferase [Acidiferrobacteraceae bacterium]
MKAILNAPNSLTLLRLVLIPVFVLIYYSSWHWSHLATALVFLLAALTDWLDGYLARKLNQLSAFGAFLDPVVDKLMVAAALILLLGTPHLAEHSLSGRFFGAVVLVIIGREITISALREWMAELGRRSSVAVSFIGKIKTTAQMVAIPFMLYRRPIGHIQLFTVGELLLYLAAALTLWSMAIYLKAAWPHMIRE